MCELKGEFMGYDKMQTTYESLTAEQQLVVYNLAVSLRNLNSKQEENKMSNVVYAAQHSTENTSLFNKKYGIQ